MSSFQLLAMPVRWPLPTTATTLQELRATLRRLATIYLPRNFPLQWPARYSQDLPHIYALCKYDTNQWVSLHWQDNQRNDKNKSSRSSKNSFVNLLDLLKLELKTCIKECYLQISLTNECFWKCWKAFAQLLYHKCNLITFLHCLHLHGHHKWRAINFSIYVYDASGPPHTYVPVGKPKSRDFTLFCCRDSKSDDGITLPYFQKVMRYPLNPKKFPLLGKFKVLRKHQTDLAQECGLSKKDQQSWLESRKNRDRIKSGTPRKNSCLLDRNITIVKHLICTNLQNEAKMITISASSSALGMKIQPDNMLYMSFALLHMLIIPHALRKVICKCLLNMCHQPLDTATGNLRRHKWSKCESVQVIRCNLNGARNNIKEKNIWEHLWNSIKYKHQWWFQNTWIGRSPRATSAPHFTASSYPTRNSIPGCTSIFSPTFITRQKSVLLNCHCWEQKRLLTALHAGQIRRTLKIILPKVPHIIIWLVRTS